MKRLVGGLTTRGQAKQGLKIGVPKFEVQSVRGMTAQDAKLRRAAAEETGLERLEWALTGA